MPQLLRRLRSFFDAKKVVDERRRRQRRETVVLVRIRLERVVVTFRAGQFSSGQFALRHLGSEALITTHQ